MISKLRNNKLEYINRLTSNSQKKVSSLETAVNKMNFFAKYFPFLSKSFIVKNIDKKIETLHISKEKYQQIKIVSLLIGVLIYLLIAVFASQSLTILSTFICLILILTLSFCVPDIYILDKLLLRKYQIFNQLPDFFSLLSLYASSSAFTTFSDALSHVAANMKGILAKDLKRIAKMQSYVDRKKILTMIKDCFDDQLIDDLVITLKLTYDFGGDLAKKISILSEEAQKNRLIRAKEAAGKAAGSLLLPIIVFQLPVLLIILLLPSVMGFNLGI